MTKEEAIIALSEGRLLAHYLFSTEEFIYMDGTTLKDESGNHMNWDDFWKTRESSNFKDNWWCLLDENGNFQTINTKPERNRPF